MVANAAILPFNDRLDLFMADDVLPILGKHIHDLRRAKGWSQPDLAKAIGTSGTIIGRYERGVATPSVDVAKRLADALGVTLDYLVAGEADADPLQDKETYERCKALAGLPEDDKGHIHRVIDAFIRDARVRLTYG